ncbi:Septum-promoting GTP-binding protein 1 [Sesamum angolense]|uniref:Septum-promoting GTP-binding protein 1 n=1 Tax=Sesamum angolense TaxID=2727404 RepID=A0AAE1T545_9LAMI|nr:Septum-promoting GTP-binding protein 1 [Sesamum angolense]
MFKRETGFSGGVYSVVCISSKKPADFGRFRLPGKKNSSKTSLHPRHDPLTIHLPPPPPPPRKITVTSSFYSELITPHQQPIATPLFFHGYSEVPRRPHRKDDATLPEILHLNIRWSILQKKNIVPRRNSSSPVDCGRRLRPGRPHYTSSCRVKYVGDEEDKRSLQMKGLNVMEKTMCIQGARIAFRIWDVGGEKRSFDQSQLPAKMLWQSCLCLISPACTLTRESRKWNQAAIPILVGTKFDDFVQLPPDIQWTIITQARAYARGLKATLFFSSAKHNINVNKIFKFIMAKLFNLPWTLHRNLTIGEPIIDF